MKLKNKKTGEIVEVESCNSTTGTIGLFFAEGRECDRAYNSLADLCKEWEDAPEVPKVHWYIDNYGDVCIGINKKDDEMVVRRNAIGNYFETEEEAKLAVCKLKAWKRLKDKGFKFLDLGSKAIDFEYPDDCRNDHSFWKDLDLLLFGGEE